MERSVKGLRECILYTQQHGHCFALKENKVGNKLKMYACTREKFTVHQTDRPTVRPTLLTATRPTVRKANRITV